MIRVYTAGPYRAKSVFGVIRNIYRAWKAAKELWRKGYAVLCPHADTILMSEGHDRVKAGVIMKGELALLEACDVLLMLPRWERSEGSILEREHAFACHIPVVYSVEELEELKDGLELRRV